MLFFAGPTGVGKTELAKTLTQLMFGDERAYIRFDMSEFAEEHKLELVIPEPIRAQLLELCTRDLSNGGRGIGNTLESVFINPLARALFALDLEGRAQVTVITVEEQDKVFSVALQ